MNREEPEKTNGPEWFVELQEEYKKRFGECNPG